MSSCCWPATGTLFIQHTHTSLPLSCLCAARHAAHPGMLQPTMHADTNSAFKRYIEKVPDSSASMRAEDSLAGHTDGFTNASNVLAQCWWRWRESELRHNTYLTLSHPEYSRLAWLLNTFIISVILISTVTFCVETIPSVEKSKAMDWLE